jgi:hypothetical protein
MKRAAAKIKMAKIKKQNGEEIDNLDSFKCLGSIITGRGSDEDEVQSQTESRCVQLTVISGRMIGS